MRDLHLSVIIPTYNRKDILKKCLNALFNQIYPQSDYEITVVDDGSTDGTEEAVKSLINGSPCILHYFKQEHKGPATARNLGIKNANAKIVLFIGDDIIATPNLIAEHMKWHLRNSEENVAVLGYVTWSPELRITPFMRWLENGGPQFSYHELKGKEVLNYCYFYTCNISLKWHFLLKNGLFDQSFKYAAYEDLELSYRLTQKGLQIFYNKDAVGYHLHPTNMETFCRRQQLGGRSKVIFNRKLSVSIIPQNRTGLKEFFKATIKKFSIPILKLVLKWLDQCGCKVPSHIYGRILYYYQQIGFKGAFLNRDFVQRSSE